ncbi:D-Ala-D-Ala carboxypeptidase family metallohydrolase [Massilia sp. TS11]|uniref:D-Ala-D-Ala carboxypeptidase family metallohydrolase n=1 Tax=Massilia sp. TS11 TaxID=2908003 RepID=UPI001EDC7191|nr:D-Ala-D-Ala carboxypeptidase family metallohydrolase [Massilia sp. TS11]MCG2585523.1 D-Ala-D-Ala carboxypeptidase family metallohydrolase [Massilia sp. TS11]
MKLSLNFTLEELTFSQTATRLGIDNTPGPDVIENLRRIAQLLERVRVLVGGPIVVSSGYRSPALNAAVGGAQDPPSAHTLGLAADITTPRMTPKALAILIRDSGIEFDQVIHEGTWVHIGLRAGQLRRQVLTAQFNGGRATYTEGVA